MIDEEALKQDLRVACAKEIHRFMVANGFKLSHNEQVDLFSVNEKWLLNKLLEAAKNGTEDKFNATLKEAVSKILAPFIPAQRLN